MAVSAQMRTQVSQLYVAMFGRAPDGEGLGFWVQQLSSGQSLTSVADTMFAVPTARAYYPSFMTNGEMVTSFYANVLNRTPDLEGFNFWTGKLNAGVTPGSVINQLIFAVTSYTGTDPVVKASKDLFMNKVTVAQAYGEASGTVAGATSVLDGVTSDVTTTKGAAASSTVMLTTSPDNLSGTFGNDIFKASILNNANTLQSGDVLIGGAGNDILKADIGNSQLFAITAETSGIETVAIRAQAIAVDTNNNNMVNVSGDVTGNQVQIDAQRMKDVIQWESNNSRADVVIEDVRINDQNLVTKNVTIAMVETDPGHVDFGVYFDQYSLRAQTNTTATLVLQLMDTRSAAAGTGPLKDNPYNGFSFYLTAAAAGSTPKKITVKSQAIDDALTYADLLTAIKAAVATVPDLAGFTVTLGSDFTVNDTLGTVLTGKSIVLTGTDVGTIRTKSDGEADGAWTLAGEVPGSTGLHGRMPVQPDAKVQLVTSKIILDDVGRGSTGGDLVVGGLSVGDTSTSKGVERFEIEVRNNSKLESINSTNNTLKEVTIKSGVTTSSSFAYQATVKDAGNLTVNGASGANGANVTNVGPTDAFRAAILAKSGFFGNVGNAGSIDPQTGENAPLPGSSAQTERNFGFSDVKMIDATDFKGKLAFSAEVTSASVAKYLNPTDIKALPAADNIAFTYTGGLNDDTMFIQLDSKAVASQNTIIAGREDFTFTANGGAGDDVITLRTVASGLTGFLAATPTLNEAWYINQTKNANVSVNGGDGNDTIWTPGAGDVKIDGGAGNDTIYADNTGALAASAVVATALTTAKAALATAQTAVPVVPADVALATTNLATATAASAAELALVAANPKAVFVFNTSNQGQIGVPAYTIGTTFDRKVSDLQSDANNSYNLYKSQVNVNFKGTGAAALGLTATATIDSTNFKTSDLQINQAIKSAINGDAVLSKLLVATDGPANTLVVTSLIDGLVMTPTDLAVTITAPAVGVVSTADIALAASAWTMAAGTTEAQLLTAMGLVTAATVTKGDYVAQLADTGVTGGSLLAGANSISVSDHTITGGADNDVIVLSTTAGANAAVSSNDIVKFAGVFGNDTIVNFTTAVANPFSSDKLDFTALGGTAATIGNVTTGVASAAAAAAILTDKSITVFASAAADTADTIKALYVGVNDSATAVTHVLIGVDAATNIAKVYTVSDAALQVAATGNSTVTLVGSIDLAGTAWGTLAAADFV